MIDFSGWGFRAVGIVGVGGDEDFSDWRLRAVGIVGVGGRGRRKRQIL